MIFMLNETGDFFEMMITGLGETDETEVSTGLKAYRLGAFTFLGKGPVETMKQYDVAEHFTFIGFI